jgi:hypothetical protein
LVAVVFVVLAPALLTSSVFFERDILGYWYPNIEVFTRAIAEGAWPLWNPYSGFGAPLLADPNFQIAYPLTWLNLWLPRAAYYKLFVTVHCLIAGAGAWALARRQGLSPASAFVAGAAFSASGPFLSAANLFHHFAGAAWMPGVLWAVEGGLRGSTRRSWLPIGVMGVMQVLAGSGDLCLITAMAVALRVGVHLVGRRRSLPSELARLIPVGGKALTFALLLSAVQWLPTLDIAGSSMRTQQLAVTSTYWSLHPGSLADLVVPGLTADLPMSDRLRAALFEAREPLLRCLYWGLPLLLLAALATPGPDRTWAALAGGCFLVAALGRHTPFYSLLLTLPGAGLLRYPVKYMVPASLFAALLAARGAEAWRGPWREREGRRALLLGGMWLGAGAAAGAAALWLESEPPTLAPWLDLGALASGSGSATAGSLGRTAAVAAVCAALLGLRSRYVRAPRWLALALLALVVADLAAVGSGVNRLAPPEIVAHRPEGAQRLAAEPGARVFAGRRAPECWEQIRTPQGWDERWARALAVQQSLSPPVGARWALYGSYDGEFSGLGSLRAAPVTDAARQFEGTPLGLRLLRMGAVDYVMSVGSRGYEGLSLLEDLPSVYPCPLRLFRVGEPMPRAYVVDGVRSEPAGDPLPALADPELDLSRSVILPAPEVPREGTPSFRGSARITWRRADAMVLEVEASGPAVLVVVEAFSPGWQATVDGRRAEILRANLLFRAVPVPAGRHRVALVYRPRAALVGIALSGVGLMLGLGSLATRRHSKVGR